jgi:hypothetical protein
MQHFVQRAGNAFRGAIGCLMFARAEMPASRTLKSKTTKTTTKTV